MTTYDVIVSLSDGEKLTLTGVTGYNASVERGTVTVDFDTGYRAIFNREQVKYIIREFDLNRK